MGSTEYWSADPLSHSGQRGTHDRQARQSIRQLVRTINEHYNGVVIADKKEEVYDHLGASGALGRQYAGLRQELWRRGMEDRVRSGRPRKLSKNEVRQADRELARNRKEVQGIVRVALELGVVVFSHYDYWVKLELDYDSPLVQSILSGSPSMALA